MPMATVTTVRDHNNCKKKSINNHLVSDKDRGNAKRRDEKKLSIC